MGYFFFLTAVTTATFSFAAFTAFGRRLPVVPRQILPRRERLSPFPMVEPPLPLWWLINTFGNSRSITFYGGFAKKQGAMG